MPVIDPAEPCQRSRAGWFIAVLLLVVSTMSPLSAGQGVVRWAPGARIRVWIGGATERPDDPALVERAMGVWNNASDGAFTLERTRNAPDARVRVRFTAGDALLGEAAPVSNRETGFIIEGDVAIAANLAGDRLQQRIVIYMTALHELGHILGLRHTTTFEDIMYFFRRPEDPERYFGAYRAKVQSADDIGAAAATGLSPGDLRALRAIYGN